MTNIALAERNIMKTVALIEEDRLSKAFDNTLALCHNLSSAFPAMAEIAGGVEKLRETYRYMVDFLVNGYPDDRRADLYADVKDALLAHLGNMSLLLKTDTPSDLYFEIRRMEKLKPASLRVLHEAYKRDSFRMQKAEDLEVSSAHQRTRMEEDLVRMFNKILTLDIADRENLDYIVTVVSDPETEFEVATQFVTALALGALRFYDKQKLLALLDIYDRATDERIQARALTSVVLAISHWRQRIVKDARLLERVESLANSILNYTRLRDVVMMIIRTRDTDRVNKKIRDTFTGDIPKINRELMDEMRKNNGVFDPVEFGENPEWEKLLKESGLEEKLRDINEMQLEGMDVMMQAFANLKNFPFFRQAANWFLPFSAAHSSVERLAGLLDRNLLDMMAQASEMCESDKYSFALGIINMPSDRMQALATQLSAAAEQMMEELKSKSLTAKKNASFTSEIRGYLRDLYRFLKLFPARKSFTDVFAGIIDFRSIPGLGGMLSEDEVVEMVGEFYFTYGYYNEALPLLEILIANGTQGRHVFEKAGYCHQVAGNHTAALDHYEKADLFSTDTDRSSMWLIRKIALCNKILKRYDRAAEYYLKALEREPDNISLLVNLGNSLIYAGLTDEARKHISKALYISPEDKRALRAAVVEEIKSGNVEKAREYAVKVLEGNTSETDWQIAAEAAYVAGDYLLAVEYYLQASINASSVKAFSRDMKEEMKFLQGDSYEPLVHSLILDRALSQSR